jgi:uncharacterized membrane protein
MDKLCRKMRGVSLLTLIICVAVLLQFFLSIVSLLEIFLITLGILCIIWGVIKLDDQIHLHRVRQQHREINLQSFRRRLPPSHSRY